MSDYNQPRGFDKARKKAKEILTDGKKLKNLLDKGLVKSKNHKNALSGFWDDLQSLIRMTRSYALGHYKDIAVKTLVMAVAAIIYFVNPFDVLPDFMVGVGFIDDATVIGFVIKNIKGELDKFAQWERGKS